MGDYTTISRQKLQTENLSNRGAESSSVLLGEPGLAYEVVWRKHAPRLLRYCLRWLSGQVDHAEEAFSRAGLVAFEKYPKQRRYVRNPGAWLTRLTYHVCMDVRRELTRRRQLEVQGPAVFETNSALMWCGEAASPEREALRSEKRAYLEGFIHSLPPNLRDVMEPLLFEGRTYREIATTLEISEMALRKRIQKARAMVRRRLDVYLAGGTPRGAPRARGRARGDGPTPPRVHHTDSQPVAEPATPLWVPLVFEASEEGTSVPLSDVS